MRFVANGKGLKGLPMVSLIESMSELCGHCGWLQNRSSIRRKLLPVKGSGFYWDMLKSHEIYIVLGALFADVHNVTR